MDFPLWKYLKQSFGDNTPQLILNPCRFWLHYQTEYLNRCLHITFLEQCWRVNYAEFVTRYQAFCDRTPLEEDPIWLLQRCWQIERRRWRSYHPENYL